MLYFLTNSKPNPPNDSRRVLGAQSPPTPPGSPRGNRTPDLRLTSPARGIDDLGRLPAACGDALDGSYACSLGEADRGAAADWMRTGPSSSTRRSSSPANSCRQLSNRSTPGASARGQPGHLDRVLKILTRRRLRPVCPCLGRRGLPDHCVT